MNVQQKIVEKAGEVKRENIPFSLNEKEFYSFMNGYFDNIKKEYVITNMHPRRPLLNYLWNEECVCQCDQFGNGFSWRAIGTQRRDLEKGERNVYIKDRDSGEIYSANRNYNDLPFDKHECHVGLGYHSIISEYKNLSSEFTILTPTEGAVTLFKLKVKNTGHIPKNISLYFCVSPKPALSWHDAYGYADYSKELNGLLYHHDGFRLPNDYTKLFVSCNKKFDAYDVGYEQFRGEYSGYHNPIGLKQEKLSCKGATFESEYVAAFQFDLSLIGEEEFDVSFCIAAAKTEEDCRVLKNKYLRINSFEEEKQKQIAFNNNYLDIFTLESPDEYLNTQVNIWLKRQLSLGKTWGRLYGKGFRDVMQDITAFVSFDPALARERILHALTYQYEDGNPIRMFEPNFRYPYNDGGVWITGAVLSYLNESGDLSILDEELTYLKGDSYENVSLEDAYISQPYVAGEKKDSVLLHIEHAIDYLLKSRGEHNLILWRGGDWNDSLNNAGLQNKGESVWLSIATVKAINELQEILHIVGNCEDEIARYEREKTILKNSIKESGCENEKYIYGISDTGERIGGGERIFLNPQTWAVLAKLDDADKLANSMNIVEEQLKCKYGYLQCYPSFTKGSDDIGRVSYFQPGLVENGAVYNHGVAFKIAADCMLGRGDLAYQSLKMISYDNPDNPNNGMEPYAVSNMYMGPENPYIAGYAPMSWITGTAGWLYRCITEYMCGIKPTVKGLKIEPCLPSSWDGFKVTRIFRGEKYEITYEKAQQSELICDGQKVDILPIQGQGKIHRVICRYLIG